MSITKEAILRRDSERLLLESSLRVRKIAGLPWADWGALLIFVTVGVVAVLHHVPGMDEAQGWLIARDLSVPGIVRQMHYEGTPPLWHLLIFLLIRLHLPYAAFGYVSLSMMAAAVYVWLRWSPLPFVVRLLVPFVFFFQYQYAVVARSYSLSTLLAFVAAALWRREPQRIIPLAIVLALLVQTNLYGFAMGAGIALAVAAEYCFSSRWERARQKPWLLLSAAALVMGSLLMAWYIARPAPDNFDAIRYYAPLHERLLSMLLSIAPGSLAHWLEPLARSLAVPPGPLSAAVLFLVIWFVAIKRFFCLLPLLYPSRNEPGVLDVLALWHGVGILAGFALGSMAGRTDCSSAMAHSAADWVSVTRVALPNTGDGRRDSPPTHGSTSPGKQAAAFLQPIVGKRPIYGMNIHQLGRGAPYFPKDIFVNRLAVWTKSSETIRQEIQMLASTFPADAVLVFGSADGPDIDPAHRQGYDPVDAMLSRGSMHKTHIFCGKMIWFSSFLREGLRDHLRALKLPIRYVEFPRTCFDRSRKSWPPAVSGCAVRH